MSGLIALQKKMGITADGVFGPATLKAAAAYFKMTPDRAAHFFGQTGHETGGFTTFTENLNYSAKGLRGVFGKYFPTDELASAYQRQPERIANRVYASRMGNGPEASGDGWKFRGRGALQVTGRNNYSLFSLYMKRPFIMQEPSVVAEELCFESAIWYFERNGLWAICDQGVNEASITSLTKRINGGTNGLDDRRVRTLQYSKWI